MRSLAFTLCFATSTFLAFSQSPPPSATFEKLTNQLTKNNSGSIEQIDRFGDREWTGQLVEITPTEKRFFRTQRQGHNQDTAKVEYGGDGSILVGLECNVDGTDTNTVVNSIRPIYLNSGRKFQ